MKTLKVAMIAALIACTMISLASASNATKEINLKVVNVSFANAMIVPGLPTAMYQQIDSDFLNLFTLLSTQEVVLDGVLYRVTGTYSQWYSFFFGHIKLIQNKEITPKVDD